MSGTSGEGATGATVSDAELVARYPSVALDHDNKEQWRGFLAGRLLVNRCLDCGHWINPPRPMCPRCWSGRVEAQEVSGRGRVQWFTLLHDGVSGADPRTPYPAVVVELEEQPNLRFTSTVVGCRPEDLVCDMSVEVTWRDYHGAPIPVFRPR
jgi:uncharacterized OB-fold protein